MLLAAVRLLDGRSPPDRAMQPVAAPPLPQLMPIQRAEDERAPLVEEDAWSPRNATPGAAEGAGGLPFPWVVTLASVLIFTIVVDIIGNLLVVISVLRNRKLRKAGRA